MFFGQKTGKKSPSCALSYHRLRRIAIFFRIYFLFSAFFSKNYHFFGKNLRIRKKQSFFWLFSRDVTPALRFSLPKTAKQAAPAPLSGEQKHTKGTARASARAALFYKEVGRGNRHGREIGGGRHAPVRRSSLPNLSPFYNRCGALSMHNRSISAPFIRILFCAQNARICPRGRHRSSTFLPFSPVSLFPRTV